MNKYAMGRRAPIFFLHIPKTAGVSLRLYLRDQYDGADVCPAGTWQEAVRIEGQLPRFRLVQGHFLYNFRWALHPEINVVVVLRDPLIRTISAFRHLQRDAAFHPDHALARDLTLKQILRHPLLRARQTNVQATTLCASAPPAEVMRYLRSALPANPAAEAVSLEGKATETLALQRLEDIEFLGTTEDLQPLLTDMANTMLYHPIDRLPIVNEAPDSRTTLDGLDAEDLDLLRDSNRIDLLLYARAAEIIAQRSFENGMARLVAAGIYRRPQGAFELDIQGPMPGSGWYSPESIAGHVWRWTGPGSRVTVDLPLRADLSYTMEMAFRVFREPSGPGFTVSANGTALDCDLERTGNSFVMRCVIAQEILAKSRGFCRLAVETGDTARPEGDLRSLGVMVSLIRFVPVLDRQQVPS